MKPEEFAGVIAYLELACGKSLSKDAVSVYFDLLGDLPAETLQIAAKRVALEHPWATFPSIAELRQAASETMRGLVTELSPAEAWKLAWHAAGRIDLEQHGPWQVKEGSEWKLYDSQIAYVCKGLPPLVFEAMHAFGFSALVCGEDPAGVIRGQFLHIYEQLAARDRRAALIPAPMKTQIARIGQDQDVRLLAGPIGKGDFVDQ